MKRRAICWRRRCGRLFCGAPRTRWRANCLPRTEQTIYCELDPPQRKMYNELRQHYREGLLRRIETEGLKKSSFQVLEALLRLRQAACHPGLIDKKRVGEGSAPSWKRCCRSCGKCSKKGIKPWFFHNSPVFWILCANDWTRAERFTNIWTAPRATARNASNASRPIRSASCSW